MKEMKPEREKEEKREKTDIDLPLGELEGEEFVPEETEDEQETEIAYEEDSSEEDAEYEARRAARLERRQQRIRRRKRKKIAIVSTAAAAAVLIGTGIYFREELTGVLEKGGKTISGDQKPAKEDETLSAKKDEPEQKEEPVEEVSAETEPEESIGENISKEEKKVLVKARKLAAQYDYDEAIKVLKESKFYEKSQHAQDSAAKYQKKKDSCVSWPLEEVTHIFYHSLIVDTSRAFDGDIKEADYNQVMTTVDEFNKITQTMYDRGYVMVSMKDMASADANGNITPGEILLPPGKIPFVLSQDDVCYYHYMDGDGYASRLLVDEKGKVRNEYIDAEGNASVGDYDVVPLIDRFVEEHPDFSYRGAKGVLALTGYNGILGYRTDMSYQTRPDDLDLNKVQWLDAHPDFDLETERAKAKEVADAMKAEGWEFASHTWGHQDIQNVSMERLQRDTQKFKENVDPLIGGTDIIIFAFGTDLTMSEDYYGEKFDFLKSQGYNYYCNVDSQKYFVQIRDNYFRMGRRNLDGYRMYYNPELVEDLFNAGDVFDPARPVPVPQMS